MDSQERRNVLSITCRWCNASPGEDCSVPGDRFPPRPITTLEGGFHSTRLRDALGRDSHIVTSSALTREESPEDEPVLVGATMEERPW